MLKNGIVALLLTSLMGTAALAGGNGRPVSSARPTAFDKPVSSARPQPFRAPTTAQLKAAIRADMAGYTKMSERQLGSKKFQGFLTDKTNYKSLVLSPKGLIDARTTAYVAKGVYPGKVFVAHGARGRVSWVKGDAPRF